MHWPYAVSRFRRKQLTGPFGGNHIRKRFLARMRPFPHPKDRTAASEQRIYDEIMSPPDLSVLSRILRAGLAGVFLAITAAGIIVGSVFASRTLSTSSSNSYSVEFTSVVSSLAGLISNTMERDFKSLSVLGEALAVPRGGTFPDFVRISEAGRASNQQEILQWVARVDNSSRDAVETAICGSVLNTTVSPSTCMLKEVGMPHVRKFITRVYSDDCITVCGRWELRATYSSLRVLPYSVCEPACERGRG